jgi:putative phosphoribosyl transferase
VPAHDEQRIRNTHYSRITCNETCCPGQVRHVDSANAHSRRHARGNRPGANAIPRGRSALPDPAQRRLGPRIVAVGRWLVLTVAPGAARAVLVMVLAARYADHGPYCAVPVRVAGSRRRGYTGGMASKSGTYVLPFANRRAAGRMLAERLAEAVDLSQWTERTVVLGLPRGGVAVAKEVAAVMRLPMDVIVTRKIGYPPQPELGVGAIAEGLRQPVYDARLIDRLGLAPEDLAEVVAAEEAELDRRVRIYRGGSPLPPVAGWCVIVVDDGLATGSTARAALRSLRAAQAAHLVLAAPVAPWSAAESLRAEADQVVILATPSRFSSVGECYLAFGQLTDADVLALLGVER